MLQYLPLCFFFFNAPAPTEIYTLSLHDALPILRPRAGLLLWLLRLLSVRVRALRLLRPGLDRKSTRLNSSHANISYAVFCLKKKKREQKEIYFSTVDGGKVEWVRRDSAESR